MNLSATIAKMRAAGMSSDGIVDCLEVLKPTAFAEFLKRAIKHGLPPDDIGEIVESLIDPSLLVDSPAKGPSGPKERWGYDGPITPMLPEREWLPLRWKILNRDGFVCRYCGDQGQDTVQWCVDHVIPLSRGGNHDESNLVACCVPCNCSKSDKLLSEWRGRYQ